MFDKIIKSVAVAAVLVLAIGAIIIGANVGKQADATEKLEAAIAGETTPDTLAVLVAKERVKLNDEKAVLQSEQGYYAALKVFADKFVAPKLSGGVYSTPGAATNVAPTLSFGWNTPSDAITAFTSGTVGVSGATVTLDSTYVEDYSATNSTAKKLAKDIVLHYYQLTANGSQTLRTLTIAKGTVIVGSVAGSDSAAPTAVVTAATVPAELQIYQKNAYANTEANYATATVTSGATLGIEVKPTLDATKVNATRLTEIAERLATLPSFGS